MFNGKKKRESIDNNFDLDSDLDLGGFDFDMKEPKDDRKPATKVATGFLNGVKDGVSDTSFLKKTLKDVLPSGFGQTMDYSDKVTGNARTLYDESLKEIKPAIKDFKRVATKLVPKESALVPKSVSDMLKRWEDDSKSSSNQSTKSSQREDFLNIQLTEAFKEQFEQGAKDRSNELAQDRMQQGLEISRHRDMFGAINQSNQYLSRIDQYQSKVTLQYQKKSLEVNYRQLFALQDILEETQKSVALQTTSFKEITKNTGLPDFVKINNSEFRSQVFKNKFYESMQKGLFGGRDDYIEKIFTNAKKAISEKVTGGVNAFRSGLTGVEMGADATKGEGMPSGYELGGNVAGSVAGQWGFTQAGKWVKKKFIDPHEGIQKMGKRLSNGIDNLPNTINDWRNSDQYEEKFDDSQGFFKKMFNGFARTVQGLLPGTSIDGTLEKYTSKDMEAPYVITRRTDKSLNEIIPGYLARILREVQIIRTKDDSIELTSYDFDSSKFISRSKSLLNAKNKLIPSQRGKMNGSDINDILKQLDPTNKMSDGLKEQIKTTLASDAASDPNVSFDELMTKLDPKKHLSAPIRKKLKQILQVKNSNASATAKSIDDLMEQLDANNLSDDAKKELRKKLLVNSTQQNGANENNLADSRGYSLKNRKEITSHMGGFFKSADEDRLAKFQKGHNTLREGINNPLQIMQEMVNRGETEILEELGLLKEDGVTFDVDKFLDNYTGNMVTSDVTAKKDFKPVSGKYALNAIKNTPISNWNYKPGKGDDGNHTGPMAQTVNKTMGEEAAPGGTKIDLTTMNGMNMAAIQELDKKLSLDGKDKKQLSTRDFLNNHLESIRCLLADIKDVSKAGLNVSLGSIPGFNSNIDLSKFGIKGFDLDKFKTWYKDNKDKAQDTIEKHKQTFDNTVPGMLSSIMYQGAGGIGNLYEKTKSKLGKASDYIKEKTSSNYKKGKLWYDNEVYDVYYEGEDRPRLYAEQIKLGKYIDVKSNVIIDHANKITGAVKIIATGNVLIKEEEIPFLYTKNPKTLAKRFLTGAKDKVQSSAKSIKNWILKQYPEVLKTAKDTLSKAWEGTKSLANKAYALLDTPIDIYVKGDSLPTLLAMTMEAGGYYSCLTKKPIIRPGEIDGPVMNQDGKVVLSLDQIKLGLVDFKGDPVKTVLDKLKNTLESFSKLGQRAGSWVIENLKAAGGYVAKGLNGLFSDFSIEINSKRSLTVLEQIRDLLYSKYGKKTAKSRTIGGVQPPDSNKSLEQASLLGQLNNVIDEAKNKLKDVYVRGENSPRILEAKLKLGHYRDKATNLTITDIKDIKGEVIDEMNKVVLAKSDLVKLTYYDIKDKAYKKLALIKSNEQLIKLGNAVNSHIPVSVSSAIQNSKDSIRRTIGITKDTLKDVYVEGSKNPVLYATKLAEGLYRDKETQKPILHQSEIEGEVIDENNNTVISANDIPRLTTFSIETNRFTALKLVGRGLMSVVRSLWHFQTKIAPKMVAFNFRMIGKAIKGTGKLIGSMFGKESNRDVFVGDEKEPRLYAKKIELGHYSICESGRVIKHHTDITGEVQDENGNVVLFDEDLDHLRVYNSILRIFNPLKLVGYVLKKTSQVIGYLQKKGIAATKWVIKTGSKLIAKTIGGVISWLSKPGNVYVVDRPDKAALSKSTMEAGGYSSEKTKKIIYKISDIDGPVKSELTGEIVLSEEDIAKGLINSKGEPIKPSMLSMIGNGLSKLNRMFSVRVPLKGTRIPVGKNTTIGEKTVLLLEDIKTIFKNKFEPKKVLGDTDGDGIRENSYADLMRKKGFLIGSKKDASKEKANALPTEKQTGLGGLFNKFFGKKDEVAKDSLSTLERIEHILEAQAAASGASSLLDGKTDKTGKKTSKLGKLAKYGGRALGVAGAAYGAYEAYKSIKDGDYTGAAKGVAIGAASGLASTAAIGGTTGMLAGSTFLGGAGAAMLGAAPVTIGVGALALVGFGLYKGYKFLNRNNLTPLQKIRYVQYGFNKSDTQYAGKVLQLEEYLKDKIKFELGTATIDEEKVSTYETLSIFGLDSKNPKDLELFYGWYQNRFKPVYLTHLTAIKAMNSGGDANLDLPEKFKDSQKKAFIESTRFSEGPYNYNALPIAKIDFQISTSIDVKNVIAEVITELGLDKVTAGKTVDVNVPVNDNNKGEPPPESKSLPGTTLEDKNDNTIKLPDGTITTASPINRAMLTGNDKAYALDAVRYRAYGVKELEPSKIRSLRLLELEALKSVVFSDKSDARWEGNPISVLETIKGSFGLSEIFGKEANEWILWFKNRFLPIYIGYLSGYAVYTGKQDISAGVGLLKPIQQVDLAKAIIGISGIWSVTNSPWSNYQLNTDSSTTKDNITFLESVAKTAQLEEDKKTSKQPDNKSTIVKPKDDSALAGKDSKNIAVQAPNYDAEQKPSSSGGSAGNKYGAGGSIAMAAGALSNGSNGANSVDLKDGVTLDGVNPAFSKLFYGMVEEYNVLTGKKIRVNDGFRTFQQQAAMKKKYPNGAAEPGSSPHEFGLAIDADPKALDEMEKLGLMKKYGLTRPIGGEDWHVEPAGIQTDVNKFKQNQDLAMEAIEGGIGRGGGGFGTIPNAPKPKRNTELQVSLLSASTVPTIKDPETKLVNDRAKRGAVFNEEPTNTSTGKPITDQSSVQKPVVYSQPTDGENKPSSAGTTGKSDLGKREQTRPSDPSVKIPEPTGSGYGGMKNTIVAAANLVGCDANVALNTCAIESGFNPNAKAKGTSASGLYQFTNATWKEMITKHGSKYGYTLANASQFDPKANSIMGAHYLKSNMAMLQGKLGRTPTATDTYVSHLFGPTGGSTLLKALDTTPNEIAANVLPSAAKSNEDLFYNNGKARTVSELYSFLSQKVNDKASEYGISVQGTYSPKASTSVTSALKTTNVSDAMIPSEPIAKTQSYTKPTVSQSITNMNRTPMSDSFGYVSSQTTPVKDTANQNMITKDLFKTSEDLLSQGLGVKKEMLAVLKDIFGVLSITSDNKNKDEVKPNSLPATKPYQVPKAPVSMRKTMA